MGVRTAAMEGLVKIALRPAFTVTRPGLAELPRPVRGGGGGGGGGACLDGAVPWFR